MLKILSFLENFINDCCEKFSRCVNAVSDGKLLLGLSLFYFLWRILFLPLFEFGGDAVWKWRFLRYWREAGRWMSLPPDHHQGRWAQNLPTAFLMNLFDSSAMWIGMILPVLCGFVLLLLIWFITRRIASKMAAVMACLSTMFYFVFFLESAQFLPSLPSTMYTLLALYLLMLYLDKPSRLWLPLLAGLVMGLAWGCKVTAGYWCVGMALFLLFFPVQGKNLCQIRKFRLGWDIILFTLGFLAVFLPEFFCINEFFQVSHGRFSMLTGHLDARLESVESPHRYNLFQYLISPLLIFLDFSGKTIYKVPFCLLFLLVLPPFWGALKDPAQPLNRKFLAFTLLVATLFHCYLVAHIFPFQHPERPLPRYFLTLSIVAFLILFTAPRLPFAGKAPALIPFRLLYRGIFVAMAIFMVIGWINDPLLNGDNLFNKIHAYQCLKMQKAENLPWLVEFEKRDRYTWRTHKVAVLWKTNLAMLPELAAMQSLSAQELEDAWSKLPPIVDDRGERYFLVAGPRPQPGRANDCIIVRETHVSREMLTVPETPTQEKP